MSPSLHYEDVQQRSENVWRAHICCVSSGEVIVMDVFQLSGLLGSGGF